MTGDQVVALAFLVMARTLLAGAPTARPLHCSDSVR